MNIKSMAEMRIIRDRHMRVGTVTIERADRVTVQVLTPISNFMVVSVVRHGVPQPQSIETEINPNESIPPIAKMRIMSWSPWK